MLMVRGRQEDCESSFCTIISPKENPVTWPSYGREGGGEKKSSSSKIHTELLTLFPPPFPGEWLDGGCFFSFFSLWSSGNTTNYVCRDSSPRVQ